jgi:hypothetical protein
LTSTISRTHRFTLAAIFIVAVLALVPAALAGKGGGGTGGGKPSGGGGSTVTGPVVVSDANGDGLPNWGDTITFKVSTSSSWPSVQLDCYQNGAPVYVATTGYYATYMWSNNYTLDNWQWTSGAANCTATLYATNKNGSSTTLASLSFPVGA